MSNLRIYYTIELWQIIYILQEYLPEILQILTGLQDSSDNPVYHYFSSNWI